MEPCGDPAMLMELCGNLPNQVQIQGRCSGTELWPGMQTSGSLKDIQRGYSLGTCASLDPTTIQYNTVHVFWTTAWRLRTCTPDPEEENCWQRIATMKSTNVPSRGMEKCLHSWLKNR